jgi:hypothetical protein
MAPACCTAGVTHWQSPTFFAYFAANSSFPAMLAEMLMTSLNMIGFSWVASPVATELEMVRTYGQMGSSNGGSPWAGQQQWRQHLSMNNHSSSGGSTC